MISEAQEQHFSWLTSPIFHESDCHVSLLGTPCGAECFALGWAQLDTLSSQWVVVGGWLRNPAANGCLNAYKEWDKPPINCCRISSIHSMSDMLVSIHIYVCILLQYTYSLYLHRSIEYTHIYRRTVLLPHDVFHGKKLISCRNDNRAAILGRHLPT